MDKVGDTQLDLAHIDPEGRVVKETEEEREAAERGREIERRNRMQNVTHFGASPLKEPDPDPLYDSDEPYWVEERKMRELTAFDEGICATRKGDYCNGYTHVTRKFNHQTGRWADYSTICSSYRARKERFATRAEKKSRWD